ncbi:hypothetical protein F5972_08750 [Microbispora cellulosiformans]|uniref:Uncharacterized protein n=1 Tax=Microbispora cellulosiformans TaxID=2614688 RepID=A0A5J5K7F3_9ACTN|nr:hypothetical protein [Microbispora cellulosiformans]KAA9379728.1 hypothetical protein F5972_08750 [Microbispora cellulosiformans]
MECDAQPDLADRIEQAIRDALRRPPCAGLSDLQVEHAADILRPVLLGRAAPARAEEPRRAS